MKSNHIVGEALVVLLCLATISRADPPPTPAAKLEALKKEYDDAMAAYRKAVEPLPETPEGEKKADELWKDFDKKQSDLFLAAVELAKADPKSDAALAALEWVLTIPRSYYLPAGKLAMELATEHHAANSKIGKIVAWIGYYGPHEQNKQGAWQEAEHLLKTVLEKNPDRAVRGQVVITEAWRAKGRFAVAEFKRSPDTDALAKDAEKAFETVLKDYGDCPRLIRENAGTLGDRAKQELNELRNLRIGKVAQEIEGEDLDGKKFKLSDYRGKVVMLDFWGHW
jgi:tetratricopeptide (TPR) repeat protein